MFVAIVILYHALRQLQLTKIKVKLLNILPPLLELHVATELNGDFSAKMRQTNGAFELTSQASVQACPGCKSYNSCKLKEPLLENERESY